MIGKFQIQLGAEQLMSGMSSSDFATDGALGVSSHDINPFLVPGAIAATAQPTDKSTNVSDSIIASIEDSITNGARLTVGNAANYYTIDSSGNVTKQATGSDTSNYVYGRTDIGIQNGASGNIYAFVTHGTDIALWNGSTTLSESWWSTVAYYTGTTHPPALTANPHPLLNYNTNLWIADGSQLHNIIPGAAFTTSTLCVNLSVLSLNLFSTIYALGVDPSTGLMMISYQTVKSMNGVISTQAFIGLYDGYSTGLRRIIPVDDLVTSFQNVGGTVYVGYGRRLGYFNGNGITFLRQLKNAAYNVSGALPYKPHMTSIANILMVVDGTYVLAYGDVVTGKKGFFYILSNTPAGTPTNIVSLFPLGSNKLGLGYATNKFSFVDFTSTSGTSNCQLLFNNIYFPRPIYVRRMRLITSGVLYTASTNVSIDIISELNALLPISNVNKNVTVPASPGIQYVFDFDFSQAKCQAIQPRILLEDSTSVLVRIIIYYDIAE